MRANRPYAHPTAIHGDAMREACTCDLTQQRRGQNAVCPSCQAWDKKRALLTNGKTTSRQAWVQRHEVPYTHTQKGR